MSKNCRIGIVCFILKVIDIDINIQIFFEDERNVRSDQELTFVVYTIKSLKKNPPKCASMSGMADVLVELYMPPQNFKSHFRSGLIE